MRHSVESTNCNFMKWSNPTGRVKGALPFNPQGEGSQCIDSVLVALRCNKIVIDFGFVFGGGGAIHPSGCWGSIR